LHYTDKCAKKHTNKTVRQHVVDECILINPAVLVLIRSVVSLVLWSMRKPVYL